MTYGPASRQASARQRAAARTVYSGCGICGAFDRGDHASGCSVRAAEKAEYWRSSKWKACYALALLALVTVSALVIFYLDAWVTR